MQLQKAIVLLLGFLALGNKNFVILANNSLSRSQMYKLCVKSSGAVCFTILNYLVVVIVVTATAQGTSQSLPTKP